MNVLETKIDRDNDSDKSSEETSTSYRVAASPDGLQSINENTKDIVDRLVVGLKFVHILSWFDFNFIILL